MVKNLKAPPRTDETVLPDQTQTKSNRFVDIDTILFFFGQLKEKGAAKKAAAKAEAGVRKQFKNAGVSLNIFDTVVNLADQDDPDAIQKFLDEFMHIASAFQQVPVGTQFNIFEGPGNAIDAKKKARDQGYMRGLSGQNPDDQAYPQNTDLGQEHHAGWYEGQDKLKAKFVALNAEKAAQDKADAEQKAEAAKRKEERAKAKADAEGRKVPVTADGDTVQ